jgi:adenylate cyclase
MSGKRGLLSDHWQCFEGIVPTVMCTASRDGTPNISYISHVYYLDEGHVALSNQFMSKTVKNIMENPRLKAITVNAVTGQQVVLDLVFDRSETQGPMFEHLAACIKAVAAHFGMDKIMQLRSADIYRVIDFAVQDLDEDPAPALSQPPAPNYFAEAAALSIALSKIEDLDQAIELVLNRMTTAFAMKHCMVLLADHDQKMLTAIASRGYGQQGAGAEVSWGQGVIGKAAETGRSLRFSGVGRHFLYANIVAANVQMSIDESRIIPLPGLDAPQSLLAVPMIAGGEVRGVIYAEAEDRIAFAPVAEQALSLVAAQLAGVIALTESSRELDAVLARPAVSAKRVQQRGRDIIVHCYAYDDSLFIDNEYVIKGVPGRILWRMLQIHAAEGRVEFTNRELRLDPSLKLPDYKDNLEARLLLLKKRLAEKDFPVKVHAAGRGRVLLEVSGKPVLSQDASS